MAREDQTENTGNHFINAVNPHHKGIPQTEYMYPQTEYMYPQTEYMYCTRTVTFPPCQALIRAWHVTEWRQRSSLVSDRPLTPQ